MALTNSQYDALMRIYDQKQARNRQIAETRRQKLYAAVPELSALDEEVASVSVASITALLDNPGDSADTRNTSKKKLNDIRTKRLSLIKEAGFSEDYLEPPYDCKDCMDTGFVYGNRCHCFKQAAINLMYSQANILDHLSKENFDTFKLEYYSDSYFESANPLSARANAKKAYDDALNFVQHFEENHDNLMILGKTGCGKTFLSNCIAKAILDKGFSVIYLTAFEFFEIFEKQTFKKDEDVSEIYDHIFTCDLLIIDDLGTELANAFTASKIYQCLNERLLSGRSTIISSNLSLQEMASMYSERTTSRVFSNYQLIKLIGEDIRLKKLSN